MFYMEIYTQSNKEEMVDAIDDGSIVRVSVGYARREGLPILRHIQDTSNNPAIVSAAKNQRIDSVKIAPFENLRRPLKKSSAGVLSSLSDNFRWVISSRRKERGLTRKQLAAALGVSDEEIKMVENGVLPSDDFILIGALERYLKVNVRKDGQDYSAPSLTSLRTAKSTSALSGSPVKFREQQKEQSKKEETRKDSDDVVLDDLDLF